MGLSRDCLKCKNVQPCNRRFVNAKKGDTIYCPDGSTKLITDDRLTIPNIPQITKPQFTPVKLTCDKCELSGRTVYLNKITMPNREKIINILRKSNFRSDGFTIRLIEVGFTLFECPECNWHKFVKNQALKFYGIGQ